MSAHGLQQEQQRQALEDERNALLSRCQELEALCERGKSAQAMAAEVESLRAQLQQVRKRVIQRDLEEEAGVMAPQAILEREQQGRQVYESIIRDLRLEIDRLTHKQHELMFKYDEAQSRAARVDALEDELRMYEEMVQHLSAESQTVALTASEVADRQAKTTHERQNLQQQLFQRDSELESARGENHRLQEELQSVREKLKTFHGQRLAADKRATELLATNAKLEATLEDFKQQYDKLVLEQEKAKRLTHTHSDALAQLRTAQSECLSLRSERDELLRRVSESRSLTQSGEREQQAAMESLSQRVTELTNENTNLSQRIHTLSQRVEHSEAENTRLRKENEALVTERDHLQHTLAIQESAHTTQQLHTLQNELSQTMSEWQALEEEKKAKESVLSQLTVEYNREKERNVLLKMQMDLLEERVKVLSEELSIFRKIDVYHTTRQRELEFHSSTVREKERERLKEKESESVKAITTNTTTTMTAISPRKLGEKKTFSSLSLTHKPAQAPSKFGLYTPHNTYTQPTQHTDTDSLSFSPSASPRMTPSQSPRTTQTQTQLTSSERLGGRLSLEDILAPTHSNTRIHTTNTTTQHTHAHTRHHTHTRAAPPPPQLLPQTQTLTQQDQDTHTNRERDGGEREEETRESVEEKRRESERVKEAERERERERTLSERATRKAQREEQLRQMVLSQEKQRLSQTLPAQTPHTHASHTHTTQNPLAIRTAVVTSNAGVAAGSTLSQSSVLSRSSSIDRNDLTTPQTSLLSSRRYTDMERARRLLSM